MESMMTHLENMRAVQYVSIAGAVVYLYDLALTFDLEMQFFWTGGGGRIGRYLFIFTRYSPLLGFSISSLEFNPWNVTLSDEMCRFSKGITVVAQLGLSVTSTGLFCLRICTLYREKRKTKALILWCFYLSFAFQTTIGGIAISITTAVLRSQGTTCAFSSPPSENLPRLVAGCLLSVLPCEMVIIVATYLHAIEAKKKHFLNHESAALPMLQRMYQDGVSYFLFAFGMRLGGAIVWLVCPSDLKTVSDFLVYGLTSVISTRFFLGLRQLMPGPIVQTHYPTPEGSLFVDTYSLAIAGTRNTCRHSPKGPRSSVTQPRGWRANLS